MNKPLDEVVNSESSEGSKIIVSGLPLDVAAPQVRELFSSIIGPVKECTINSNDAGQPTGSASVIFTRREDALLAYKKFNDRMIDGGQHTLSAPYTLCGGQDRISRTWSRMSLSINPLTSFRA
ncbi:hypothetical protein FS837_012945 [Tulasnella sp. UAMH 9824]|nr:hypothetical protein FS837_012945 [Tulasnella sp. UAMH 9824]